MPGQGGPSASESNGAAVTSLIFGIAGFFCLYIIGPIVAIITGIIGRKKPAKRGMATTGLVLGIVGLVVHVLAIIVFVVAGGFLVESTKTVSPSDYDVVITDCQISAASIPSAEFEITNTDDKTRNFLVEVKFESATSSSTSTSSAIVTDVAPGETKSGSVTGLELSGNVDRGECVVTEVRNFFS